MIADGDPNEAHGPGPDEPKGFTSDASDSLRDFMALSVTEVLNQDSRPTFVLDLDPDEPITANSTRLVPVFYNTALRLHERLLDDILGSDLSYAPTVGDPVSDGNINSNKLSPGKLNYDDFRSWATGVTIFDDSKDVFPLSFVYHDLLWTGSTIRKRWRLISGNLWRDLSSQPSSEISVSGPGCDRNLAAASVNLTIVPTPTDISGLSGKTTLVSSKPKQRSHTRPSFLPQPSINSSDTGTSSTSKRLYLAAPDKVVSDWTVERPKGVLSAHQAFARTIPWGATPLGPMEQWSQGFRQMANLVMGNPHPAALFWGADLTMLYNEAYATEVAGNKHPNLMGTGFSGPFSELWDGLSSIFSECARTGVSIRKEDDCLSIERHGFLEETFYSWSWTPLYGGTKRILGFYNAPFETTKSVLSQRRMQTVNRVGENVSRARSPREFWKLVLKGLKDNHFDVPLALLYSVGEVEEGDQSSVSSTSTISLKSCYLEGTIAIPDGHIAAPVQLDLKRGSAGFVPAFREAMRTRAPTLIHVRDGSLPEHLVKGIKFRGFGEPCREAVIIPVRPTNGDNVVAFLLIGLNPRSAYNEGYRKFATMLSRQLATSLASFMLYEEEIRRTRDTAEAAALEKEQANKQLALQASRLRRMTELSLTGLFLLSPEGVLREGNNRYFEMTGHPRDNMYELSWMEQIANSSKADVKEGWRHTIVDYAPWTYEVKLESLGAQPVDLNGEPIDYWVMMNAQPEFAPDGSVRSVLCSMTDISHLKWAQGLQTVRLQEAEETRRQQNEFIDITSHEMRNPLSAILQCADDIFSTLGEYRAKNEAAPFSAVEACAEAAETISLCVQHQKSIVDDILTVSKLDSNLLVLTPVRSQPVDVVKRAVAMFDPELQAKEITMVFDVHKSWRDLAVDWVTLDPSRVLQILINLITNAIKFTAAAQHRKITVSVRVSEEQPLVSDISDFVFLPARNPNDNWASGDDWGDGEMLYVLFRVQDTGCGLTSEEMKVLFERFSQASPRTHAQYGGSGLGLFISRQLAELHGGRIGVASKAAQGSVFGFFVGAKRSRTVSNEGQGDLPMRPELLGATLFQPISPQRQDMACLSLGAGLVASAPITKGSKVDPRDLEILVVEDNLVNQNVLVKQLKKVGSSTNVANDGIEALAFLDGTRFRRSDGRKLSIILMDLEMPNMDGLTCVRKIRKMEETGQIHGHVPVIAVTANVRAEQIETAKRAGMDDLVSKPFRVPDLIKKIQALLLLRDAAEA